jgi:hypothetical protein
VKKFLIIAALGSLAACTTPQLDTATTVVNTIPTESPAPLQRTIIDDKAIVFAYQSYDMVLDLTDIALDAKLITPGSPQALKLKSYLQQTRYWLNAASAAQKAGSVTSYNSAFANARNALAQARLALGR